MKIIESFRTLKDKTFKVTFETNELSPESVMELSQNLQHFGYLAFKRDNFTKHDIEIMTNLKADYNDMGKSPAQRLRAVLYVTFEQKPEGYKGFNSFYEDKMEQLINHFKNKLD